MLVSAVFLNDQYPNESRPFDNVTELSFVQPSNAELPMVVTLSGIITLLKVVQYLKASALIVVTVSGIIIDSRPVQFANKYCATLVAPTSKVAFFN